MADADQWASNANEAIQIRLRHEHAHRGKKDVHFQPAFTYPIYGDEETIYGYSGLRIKLDFDADTLAPALDVSWRQKMEPTGDEVADEPEEPLKALLPSLGSSTSQTSESFEPPGELLHQYEIGGTTYGVWCASLEDAAARRLLQNMQIFILFFIEGGSCIALDDPDWTIQRWRAFFIYAMDTPAENPGKTTYSFVGYSTAYRLFFLDTASPSADALPDASIIPSDWQLPTDDALLSHLPSRERISQFLILPPYQHKGHGSHLYETMMSTFLADDTIKEITVEDPNESFDDLRDQNDMLRLRNDPAFASLTIDPSAKLPPSKTQPVSSSTLISDVDAVSSLHKTSKIAQRQFSRLLEMQLLSRIPARNRQTARITKKDRATDPQDRAYFFWRLLVKQRLYKHNVDALAQLDLDERVDKLEETLAGVERDYLRILEAVDKRAARDAERVPAHGPTANGGAQKDGQGAAANGAPTLVSRGVKRRVLDDEEDDLDDEESAATDASKQKKQKIEA